MISHFSNCKYTYFSPSLLDPSTRVKAGTRKNLLQDTASINLVKRTSFFPMPFKDVDLLAFSGFQIMGVPLSFTLVQDKGQTTSALTLLVLIIISLRFIQVPVLTNCRLWQGPTAVFTLVNYQAKTSNNLMGN